MLTRPITPRRAARKAGSKTSAKVDRQCLDALLGFQLRLAYVAILRHFATSMAEFDLTQQQTGVLWLIGANAGVSQIALATQLGMDRASMMAIVDRLEMRKIIVRERSRHDGRRQELYLTPKGRKVLKQSQAALLEHEQRFTGRFTAEELAAFMDALRRVQG